ncbi:hypothetical protein [Nocardioides sp. B-3]|uniref:hypothetical protein n=1 Tax=Nocardioides sp. B-3 TaxID=2895565 RepID=UPI003FA52695
MTTNDRVPSGAPDRVSSGEVLPRSATRSSFNGWPSDTSALLTVNDGTGGR